MNCFCQASISYVRFQFETLLLFLITIESSQFSIGSIALAGSNSTKAYKQPSNDEINYVLLTESENISIPVTQSLLLWAHEKFNAKKKVVVMITGWNTDINEENTAADEMWKAYKSRGDTNFILIDTARYVDTLYAWSAFNTKELGKVVGEGLAELINYVPLEKIHVMGHSLGGFNIS